MSDVLKLLEDGLSPAEAVDYYAVIVEGMTQTEWARKRGIAQGSVSENISKAQEKLATE